MAGLPGGVDMGSIVSAQLMQAATMVEEQIDAEMSKMEKLPDEDEMEVYLLFLNFPYKNSLRVNEYIFFH